MKKTLFIPLLILVGGAYAQRISSDADTLAHQKLLTVANINREQSYLTFGNGFGNLQPLITEAKLSAGYLVTTQNRPWALMFNPQIQFRMLNRRSIPIRSPSYQAYFTFYRAINFRKHTSFPYQDALWFASVGHHSNGQDGAFYQDDSAQVVDVNQGNFTTNLLRLGAASYALRPVDGNTFSIREIKAHVEIHPAFPLRWHARELTERYGLYRLFFTYRIADLRPASERPGGAGRWTQRSGIHVQTGWIFGDLHQAEGGEVGKRLILDVRYLFYPRWFDAFALFVRYYRGQDYYNTRFSHTLSNVSFGITSNITRPGEAVKYFKRKQ